MSKGKLTYSSAIFLSISSMIGAGIFMKTQTLNKLSQNSLSPIFLLFFIFLINIFAFTYVLIKIIPSQNSNAGFMEWAREYCSPQLNAAFVNFIRYFYHPISLVLFSVYGVLGISGNSNMSTLLAIVFAVLVVFILMFINLISFKIAHKIQLVLWSCVLIPLILLPIFAIAYPSSESTKERATGIDGLGSWMVLLSGLPSLLFIYDGFYNLASLKDKLDSSKDLVKCLVISIIAVTLIYLYVIIGFSIGSPNSDYQNFNIFKGKPALKELFEILTGLAGFMTLNSIALSNIPQLTAMNDTYNFKDLTILKRFLFYKSKGNNPAFENKFISWIYLLLQTFFWFIVIGIASFFGGTIEVLDALADIVSAFVFGILVAIIIGSLKKNLKDTPFIYAVIFSSSLIIIALLYLFTSYLTGAFGFAGANRFSFGLKLSLLLLFLIGSFFPQIKDRIDRIFNANKYALHHIDNNSLTTLNNGL
ncbi:amino acid permease [Candidatus Mycoplasma haematobovis]|uniref:Amino acid permease n=1 Tax=Candidatus Mycoplasma haematobovis TaxID=432608 RepID=A0A1A9QDT7_9MOLU|nr:amino acid permease [Candidatus Mycoplasma haematobovis]OAL10161.1 amino acid permease [Candidatus Mycoplasma haematobovis]